MLFAPFLFPFVPLSLSIISPHTPLAHEDSKNKNTCELRSYKSFKPPFPTSLKFRGGGGRDILYNHHKLMYLIQHEKYIKNNNWWWLWMWKESGNGRAAGAGRAQVSYNAQLNSTQPRGVRDALSIPVLAPSLPYPLPSVNGFYVSSPLSFAIGGAVLFGLSPPGAVTKIRTQLIIRLAWINWP